MMSGVETEWPKIRLGLLLKDIQPGFASGKHNSIGTGIPHFRPMNVSADGRIERAVLKYVDPSAGRPDLRLRRGDVVFNNTNSPELVGKTAFFNDDDMPAFSNHMTRLRTDTDRLDPEFLAIRLHQAWREGWFAAHCNNHVSQASIGRDVLKEFEIELPPIADQREIAALYREADASRMSASAHLTSGQRAIDLLRQAVLAAAVSGRLTADWREAHAPSSAPSGDVNQRETAPHGTWPEIPGSWTWAPIERLLKDSRSLSYGILKPGKLDPNGVPMVRVMDIVKGAIRVDQVVRVSARLAAEYTRTRLEEGDVVLAVMATVGRSAVVPPELSGANVNRALAVLKLSSRIDPYYLNLAISSPHFQNVFASEKLGSAQSRINLRDLRSFIVPLPPGAEQKEIVHRAEMLLGRSQDLAQKIDGVERSIASLTQSILAKAFRGELNVGQA